MRYTLILASFALSAAGLPDSQNILDSNINVVSKDPLAINRGVGDDSETTKSIEQRHHNTNLAIIRKRRSEKTNMWERFMLGEFDNLIAGKKIKKLKHRYLGVVDKSAEYLLLEKQLEKKLADAITQEPEDIARESLSKEFRSIMDEHSNVNRLEKELLDLLLDTLDTEDDEYNRQYNLGLYDMYVKGIGRPESIACLKDIIGRHPELKDKISKNVQKCIQMRKIIRNNCTKFSKKNLSKYYDRGEKRSINIRANTIRKFNNNWLKIVNQREFLRLLRKKPKKQKK